MSDPSGPSYLVVDTNVAVKWYLTEDLEDEALSLLEAGERGDVTLLAPDSLEPVLERAVATPSEGRALSR